MSEQSKAAGGSPEAAAIELKFSQMTGGQKMLHLLKLMAFLGTFGFAYPHVMDQF